MNERQKRIIDILLNSKEYQPISNLEKKLNCSNKTLRNDLTFINEFFIDQNLDSTVLKAPGKGIFLQTTPYEKARINANLKLNQLEIYPFLNRFFSAFLLLSNQHNLSLDDIADGTFSSLNTIKKEIPYWNSFLNKFNLHLKTEKSISLIGEELNIRLFLIYYFFNLSSERFFKEVSKKEIKIFEEVLVELTDYHGYELTQNAKTQLFMYLRLAITRIKINHNVTNASLHLEIPAENRKKSMRFYSH